MEVSPEKTTFPIPKSASLMLGIAGLFLFGGLSMELKTNPELVNDLPYLMTIAGAHAVASVGFLGAVRK